MSVLPAPPVPAPTDLATLAQALLDAVAARLTVEPSRRYLTTGQPVAEGCDTLAVSWTSVGYRVPGSAPTPTPLRIDNVRSAELTVWLFRCQEGTLKGQGRAASTQPSPAKLTADGMTAMRDAVEMHRAVVAARIAGAFGDFARAMSVGDVAPLQPEGGVCGNWMPVVVQLS